jgi:hypothetical protein
VRSVRHARAQCSRMTVPDFDTYNTRNPIRRLGPRGRRLRVQVRPVRSARFSSSAVCRRDGASPDEARSDRGTDARLFTGRGASAAVLGVGARVRARMHRASARGEVTSRDSRSLMGAPSPISAAARLGGGVIVVAAVEVLGVLVLSCALYVEMKRTSFLHRVGRSEGLVLCV